MNTNEVLLKDAEYDALVAEIVRRLTPSRDAVVEALADFGVIPERVRDPIERRPLPESLTRFLS